MDVGKENIVKEKMDLGIFSKEGGIHATMYSCPNCHILLVIAQYTSW
jgi:hypothetical protein